MVAPKTAECPPASATPLARAVRARGVWRRGKACGAPAVAERATRRRYGPQGWRASAPVHLRRFLKYRQIIRSELAPVVVFHDQAPSIRPELRTEVRIGGQLAQGGGKIPGIARSDCNAAPAVHHDLLGLALNTQDDRAAHG